MAGFAPQMAFSLIESSKKKALSGKDISAFLKSNGVYKSEKDISNFLQARTQDKSLLTYNEFTKLVGSNPKQVVNISLEVQRTQRDKIKQQLSRFFEMLINAATIVKALRKDITSAVQLDYYELQLLFDPENSNCVTFENLKRFMDECGKGFTSGDHSQIAAYISGGERLKFKDMMDFFSGSTVTSVVVTNRSRSGSPSKELSRSGFSYRGTKESTLNESGMSFRKLSSPRVCFNESNTFTENSFKVGNMTDSIRSSNSFNTSNEWKRNKSGSINIEDYSIKHPSNRLKLNSSKSGYESSSSVYSQENDRQNRRSSNNRNNQSYTLNSSIDRSKSRQYNNSTSKDRRASPTKSIIRYDSQCEPSLFKNPSLYFEKRRDSYVPQTMNSTLSSVTRIPLISDSTVISPKKQYQFDSQFSRYNNQKQSLSLSMNQRELSVIQQDSSNNQQEEIFLDLLQQLSQIAQFEESLEDYRKLMARTLSFSPIDLFNALDQSKNGYLRQTKFPDILKAISIKISETDAASIFTSAQKHLDGFLSKEEFVGIFKSQDQGYNELSKAKSISADNVSATEIKLIRQILLKIIERNKFTKNAMQQLKQSPCFDAFSLFSLFDNNQEGVLNASKFAHAFRSRNLLIKENQVRLLFTLLVRSNSGSLNYSQFLQFLSPQ